MEELFVVNPSNGRFQLDHLSVDIDPNRYTVNELAMAITIAFHSRGMVLDRECFYDSKTDTFRWRPTECPK